MGYLKVSYGPGDIAALPSGIGLTMGPTIGSNDPRVPMSGMGVDLQLNSACPAGQRLMYAGTRSERCMPIVNAPRTCPTGQVMAFSADGSVCVQSCDSYQCPPGKYKSTIQESWGVPQRMADGSFTSSHPKADQMRSMGCTVARGCSDGIAGPGQSAKTTYCCPSTISSLQPEQPVSLPPQLAPPPPPSIVTTGGGQTVAPGGHGPLFWLGLGAVGIGLVLVLRKK